MTSEAAQATRDSINQHFPLGPILSRGSDNPITIHDVDDALFSAVWALIAETMVVGGSLSRFTKEEIASAASDMNECPVCVVAHNLMSAAARKVVDCSLHDDAHHCQAMAYAKAVQCATAAGTAVVFSEDDVPKLDPTTKAEVALVVLVFEHMNRVVGAIMGQQMSTAMIGLPRPFARAMEAKSTMKWMNMVMAPMITSKFAGPPEQGITRDLFPAEDPEDIGELPTHLLGVKLAGKDRAHAVSRLHAWTVSAYKVHLKDIVSPKVVDLLDQQQDFGRGEYIAEDTATWLEEQTSVLENVEQKAIAAALLMGRRDPQRLYNSDQYKALVKVLGKKEARLALEWDSLRLTLARAKGLE